ncbi:L-gulonolactone oxidase 5 [Hibiscus syriacus]|uniref:L-gulonolactone oxidase n=1 Tax=Hibiscus syriacus TaxID=106335 RepID=A0A6A3C2T3_HIBSY|nr:L-gulonolactone oxidase 5 [Hibiscus syriacus]
MFHELLLWACLFLLVVAVSCTPPAEPVKCSKNDLNFTVTNSYGMFPDRAICRAGNVAYPKTEQELVSVLSAATEARRKMKVVTRFSQSIPKLVCPDGQDGLLISTKHLNRVVKTDKAAMTMTVESGVTLRQLINEAAKVGLALPYAPYWWGLTIGGILGTGAHGSSLWEKGSAVHDYVVEMRIVSPAGADEGYAKVRVLNERDQDFDAAKVSLGVLGVISHVRDFETSIPFKRSITYVTKDDKDLGDEAVSFGKLHEFADIIWYPSQRKAVYRIDDRVSINKSGNGLYDFTPFRSTPSLALALTRSTEETQESLRDANGKCLNAKVIVSTLQTAAYGLTNNGVIFTCYPVIGFHNRLQSSGTCLDSLEDALITACGWDPRIKGEFFHQTTFSVSLSVVKSFIEDVQKLVAMDPKSLCGLELYNGILMRYVKASTAYLGNQEDAIDFDISYYRSKDPTVPRLYQDILEEIEQMALFKYGALPHWGKNRNLAFDGVIKKYKKGGEFLKVKNKYDPLGLFSSEWTDQVLGLRNGVTMLKEGCSLEGLCVCSQDVHCSPANGYLCRPGKTFKQARVCTFQHNI